jgi:hypothetical protein
MGVGPVDPSPAKERREAPPSDWELLAGDRDSNGRGQRPTRIPRPPSRATRDEELVLLGFFLLGPGFLDDLLGDERGDFFVVGELHRVAAAAAGHGA